MGKIPREWDGMRITAVRGVARIFSGDAFFLKKLTFFPQKIDFFLRLGGCTYNLPL